MIRPEVDVRVWKRDAIARLATGSATEPERDLRVILQAVCGSSWPPEMTPAEERRLDQLVDRRGTGVPLAYVVGTAGFRYLELEVNEQVLIPRPETEGLVQTVLDWARNRGEPLRGLEIGVGSGAVVLSLAVEGRFTTLVGTDISSGALRVADRNRSRLGVSGVCLLAGSLLDPIHPSARYDVIVSNPPYLTAEEFTRADPSVREYEPRLALVSGSDGLAHIAAICRAAHRHLAPGGLLALEIDARRATEAGGVARTAGLDHVRVTRDVFGRDRFLTAIRGDA